VIDSSPRPGQGARSRADGGGVSTKASHGSGRPLAQLSSLTSYEGSWDTVRTFASLLGGGRSLRGTRAPRRHPLGRAKALRLVQPSRHLDPATHATSQALLKIVLRCGG
jgi:hypothetical protein